MIICDNPCQHKVTTAMYADCKAPYQQVVVDRPPVMKRWAWLYYLLDTGSQNWGSWRSFCHTLRRRRLEYLCNHWITVHFKTGFLLKINNELTKLTVIYYNN